VCFLPNAPLFSLLFAGTFKRAAKSKLLRVSCAMKRLTNRSINSR
jgi:hypothetical protein